MMRFAPVLGAIILLAACAPPELADPARKAPEGLGAPAPVAESAARTAPEDCIEGDDGIGGTGCRVE